jgi:ABC-type Fe3+-hydroxamate transport system substrate-binding protein
MSLNPPVGPSPSPSRTIAPALFAVVVLVVAGVAVAGTAAYFEFRPMAASHPAGAHSVRVVDDLGRQVTVPVNASRIVVLAPSVMDIVARLGLRSHVVGIGCEPKPASGINSEYSPNQTNAWNLSSSMCIQDFPTLNVEEVVNLSADLVLASTITSAASVETLSTTYNIPVILLAPNGLDGIIGDVSLVAQVYPGNTLASPLIASLHSTLTNASKFDANLSTNNVSFPTVLLTYYFDTGGYYTYGPGTFGDAVIALAGGTNVVASAPLLYFEMNGTTVLNDQPKVIIYGTSWNDPALVSDETPSVWNAASSAPYWSQLTGTKQAIDVTQLTEADPTLILTLPLYEHWLHPTLVPAP